jgi:pimeloyl-ACP methyl ester carboxylesterase
LEPFLSQKFRVTSFDFPGWSGQSRFKTNKLKLSFIDHRNLAELIFKKLYSHQKKVDIGGVSVGGMLSLMMAASGDPKIGKVFAVSCLSNGRNIQELHQISVAFMQIGYKFPLLANALKKYYKFGKSSLIKKSRWCSDELVKLITRDYQNLDPEVVLGFALDCFRSDHTNDAPKIKNEVVLVGAEKDTTIPAKVTKKLSNMLPRARYFEIKGGSHYVMATHPEIIAKIILKNASK